MPANVLLEKFGEKFLDFCQDSGYDRILQVLGATPRDFLQVRPNPIIALDCITRLFVRIFRTWTPFTTIWPRVIRLLSVRILTLIIIEPVRCSLSWHEGAVVQVHGRLRRRHSAALLLGQTRSRVDRHRHCQCKLKTLKICQGLTEFLTGGLQLENGVTCTRTS